ncbi:hypothetical protein [Antarctobacter heliothermus]|uniref:Uncharacterized protein n=1 Tax=Antarctobacter heliothermus TaxID=74033 RepID=A0A239MDV7_9RHOB|nr:hypothetical protein [Antarctobacter heliothermus]SNT40019.1 hypothetical protein SAMN04488078_11404 [Antarctobacter heliothermus]
MTQTSILQCPTPLEVAVILGTKGVDAYYRGEIRIDTLLGLGPVKTFNFLTVPEVNAFIQGVDATQGFLDALATDDLRR